ncbi:HNH endonuclease [Limnoraphis robusta]|uniref:HNH endonuclease n=1 Tax=Limnoraphis robusta CCNP1315 TaxID=3110306 RepID=A0ABU5U488_9CYAN|nr:HNH endonuclease [Limnoraphis robusta]MEA5521969.1 HNH endonuclease [Limnoraphis robusta CCNP1315]MEA5545730.1 HNH endonuclease [Limnoraphis robusta CCNP1324]
MVMQNSKLDELIDSLYECESPYAYIVSYYLSRFDKDAYTKLGLGNKKVTHEVIGKKININANTLKNQRDSFDAIHDNPRKGWWRRELWPAEKKVVAFLENYSHDEIYNLVYEILNNPTSSFVDVLKSWENNQLIDNNISNQYDDYSGKNIKREVNQRQGQEQFRQKVLDNFRNRCCLTGEQNIRLLEASHIIPWSIRLDTQLDPRNGLCLSWIYHKLFDEGYFTIDNHLIVHISNQSVKLCDLNKYLLNIINGTEIQKPIQYNIHPEYLEYHRNHIFKHL